MKHVPWKILLEVLYGIGLAAVWFAVAGAIEATAPQAAMSERTAQGAGSQPQATVSMAEAPAREQDRPGGSRTE
jgi:hypothetical protein